ncbi:MAG: isoprenyl transferase [Desulfobacterales bacterium]|nr:isoprenyl transferase [Desulfobacterales bacterium]
MSSSNSASGDIDIDKEKLPTHVAIIMDGNGRWAQKHLFKRVRGHEKGAETVRTIIRTSRSIGIPILTLYAFSTENWQRPKHEVMALMSLLKKFLISECQEMVDNNIRLNVIGQVEKLPKDVQETISETKAATAGNNNLLLNLALSYGSRAEIVESVQRIAAKVKNGDIDVEAITPDLISDHLYTGGMADPDLLIRTSGEMRISNFLLWQIAYSEIYVTETLWPDFSKEEYLEILKSYRNRERRFGKVPLQGK